MKILIVEDEKLLADSLKTLLESKGFDVETVYDGISGAEYAELGVYDLLILDVMMPGMDGYAVARSVRARRCGVRWNPACRRSPNAVGFCTCSAKSPIARGGAGLLRAPLRAQARTGEGCPISGTWISLPVSYTHLTLPTIA